MATNGPELPMNPGTLRFHSGQTEAGFVQSLAERLLSGMAYCASAVLAVNCFLIINFLWWVAQTSSVVDPYIWYAFYSMVFMSLVCLWMVALAKCRKLQQRVGLVQREALVIVVFVLFLMQLIYTRPWYMVQVLGMDMWELDNGWCQHASSVGTEGCRIIGCEADLMMELCAIVAGAHFAMPVRWIIMLIMEVLVVALYAIAVFAFRSGQQNAYILLILLAACVFVTALGKRQLEIAERRLFLQLVAERTLRAEAEFQLSQVQSEPPKADEVESAVASAQTSGAGRIFAQPDALHMQPLLEIGRREQWLLDATDLSVDIDAVIGIGGFGIVASGRFLRTPVAVKLVKQRSSTQPSLADIGNELRVLRKLRHPNIVGILGACIDPQHPDLVVVLEYVFGQPLDLFVREYHTPGQKTLETVHGAFMVLLGVCRALVYLHARQPTVVHGDLKGSNIYVECRKNGPNAKLLDFGLARVISGKVKPLGGTRHWKAPEVFEKRRPTPAADVFSFGRVIYFVCTGKSPLQDLDRKASIRAARGRSYIALPWPQEETAEIEWCRPLVEAASATDPIQRPSASDLCRDVERGIRHIEDVSKGVGHRAISSLVFSSSDDSSTADCGGNDAAKFSAARDVSGFWGSVRKLREAVHHQGRMQRIAQECIAEGADRGCCDDHQCSDRASGRRLEKL